MKKEKAKAYFVDSASIKNLFIDGYEISLDPMEKDLRNTIGNSNIKEYLQLLEKAQLSAKSCLKEVEALSLKCPSSPEVNNLLCYVLLQNKKVAEAEALIESAYKKFPDYFFAKINYADQQIRKKNYDVVQEIFPYDDLKDNCMGRTKFHISEYRSFMVLKGQLYHKKGNKEKSRHFYKLAHQADPAHPSVMNLEKKVIKKNLLSRLIFFGKHLSRK